MESYAKVIVLGSPISKSNFKLFNKNGRAILPTGSGKYYDRYANYEELISYEARLQNPGIVLQEGLIALLKVFYKSEKRHPDTNNITKSIFDGIEKSGLIVNDVQIKRIIIEEFYDGKNPRFELELFGESSFKMDYSIIKREKKIEPIIYSSTVKSKKINCSNKPLRETQDKSNCFICGKKLSKSEAISINKGKNLICKSCLLKGF